MTTRVHGGPGSDGPASFDFSTTANARGPHAATRAALNRADHSRYPDPAYRDLRARIAALHGVSAERVLFAGSGSEFIFRCAAVSGRGAVCVPRHAFGDYTSAAEAFGRRIVHDAEAATLAWFTDPGSPRGEAAPPPVPLPNASTLAVLDRACAPLRLGGKDAWSTAAADGVFQLFSPNKALGLTGVRAAYAIAPAAGSPWVAPLERACASWPLGAAGVALLDAWTRPATQRWVVESRAVLARWKRRQDEGLTALGFEVAPSVGNFALVRAPRGTDPVTLERALTGASIAWRDTTSFGLPGAWRVSVQGPTAQRHLFAALARVVRA